MGPLNTLPANSTGLFLYLGLICQCTCEASRRVLSGSARKASFFKQETLKFRGPNVLRSDFRSLFRITTSSASSLAVNSSNSYACLFKVIKEAPRRVWFWYPRFAFQYLPSIITNSGRKLLTTLQIS